jgi:uncharacterized damage-inducible protein DinB
MTASPSPPPAAIGPNVFGPTPGFSPQIGILVSEMAWMREAVLSATHGMTQEQLDFLLDSKANRIGALLLHLAATEKLYQLNTFDNMTPNQLDKSPAFANWALAMDLGEPARKAIKGNDLAYYLNLLQEGREKTLAEFRKRDDAWLMTVDASWGWGPTNNLCKWFHVCEHESHHTGQISLLKSRIPGAKSDHS